MRATASEETTDDWIDRAILAEGDVVTVNKTPWLIEKVAFPKCKVRHGDLVTRVSIAELQRAKCEQAEPPEHDESTLRIDLTVASLLASPDDLEAALYEAEKIAGILAAERVGAPQEQYWGDVTEILGWKRPKRSGIHGRIPHLMASLAPPADGGDEKNDHARARKYGLESRSKAHWMRRIQRFCDNDFRVSSLLPVRRGSDAFKDFTDAHRDAVDACINTAMHQSNGSIEGLVGTVARRLASEGLPISDRRIGDYLAAMHEMQILRLTARQRRSFLATPNDWKSSDRDLFAGELVEIDEHTLDIFGKTPEGTARFHVLAAKDVATRAVIGLVVTDGPASAQDLRMLLFQILVPCSVDLLELPFTEEPLLARVLSTRFDKGLLVDGGSAEFPRMSVNTIAVDMGKIMIATETLATLRIAGVSVLFGPPAQPIVRAGIENYFRLISFFVKRLYARTGSSPDQRGNDDMIRIAATLTKEQIADLLVRHAVFLYNNRPHPGLPKVPQSTRNMTPRQYLDLQQEQMGELALLDPRDTLPTLLPSKLQKIGQYGFQRNNYRFDSITVRGLVGKSLPVHFIRHLDSVLWLHHPDGGFVEIRGTSVSSPTRADLASDGTVVSQLTPGPTQQEFKAAETSLADRYIGGPDPALADPKTARQERKKQESAQAVIDALQRRGALDDVELDQPPAPAPTPTPVGDDPPPRSRRRRPGSGIF